MSSAVDIIVKQCPWPTLLQDLGCLSIASAIFLFLPYILVQSKEQYQAHDHARMLCHEG